MHPVDDDADPQVLARLVALPLVAGADRDRGRVARLTVDPLDAAAQFLRRPERVDQLDVVVGEEGEKKDWTASSALRRIFGTLGVAPRSAKSGVLHHLM